MANCLKCDCYTYCFVSRSLSSSFFFVPVGSNVSFSVCIQITFTLLISLALASLRNVDAISMTDNIL